MLHPDLINLWERTSHPEKHVEGNSSWNKELETLFSYGIGMEETLRFLYSQKPTIESFEQWVAEKSTLNLLQSDQSIENTLSPEDLKFFETNGYVVVRNAISKQDCEKTCDVIWDFLKMDKVNPDSWYKPHEELRGLMLTFTNHPALNKNRNSLRIQKAYEQIYNSTEIYKSIDKVSFNPPETDSFKFAGEGLHWDVSLKLPIAFCLQGLLYLTDCNVEDGAFACVPGFHTKLNSLTNQQFDGASLRAHARDTLSPTPVTGLAGDFIIWHQALPHCATPNKGKRPRLVQYLTYKPLGYKEEAIWI